MMMTKEEALDIEMPAIQDDKGHWWVSGVAFRKVIDQIYDSIPSTVEHEESPKQLKIVFDEASGD
jgi:hypothetical protein